MKQLLINNKLETSIFNYKSKEFLINLKSSDIPPKGHIDRGDFILNEKNKCKNGVTINGVHINGALYYHLNFHTIALDVQENNRVIRIKQHPSLRDNDWILFNEYDKALVNKKAFVLGGSRQIGKSEQIVSMSCRELFLYENSEVLGLFSIKNDKETYMKKLRIAMEDTSNFLVIPAIDKDFTKTQLRFGITKKDNTPIVYSTLFTYLTSEGENTESGAGKTVSFFFFDEIAKYPFKQAYEAVLPALRSEYGFRCSPLLCFTGGYVSKSKDAQNIFLNPIANNVADYENDNKQTGFFMPALYRQDFKKEMLFADYLDIKVPKNSELYELKIKVSDKELALTTLTEEYKLAEQDKDPSTLLKKKIYDPLKIDDMFLSEGGSPFEAYKDKLKKHKKYLELNPIGRIVDVNYNNGNPTFKSSTKTVIKHFPKLEYESKDCGIMMYEPPLKNNLYWLHVGGLDPYNTNKSDTSSSLGSFYLFRRTYSDLSDSFQDTMVVSYYARPDKMTDFLDNIKCILLLYNGTMLHEQSNDIVLNHFDKNNEAKKFLCETWNLSKEINPQSNAKSSFGLAPTVKNQDYIIENIHAYLSETIGFTKDGDIIEGYTRILDPLLIDELIEYTTDGNFDRIWGFGHAIVYYKYLDKYYKVEEVVTKVETRNYIPNKSPFSMGGKSPFYKK